MPLWLLSIDAGLNHARLGLAPLAGLLLGLAGVALLSGLGDGGAISVSGALIILGAAAMWTLALAYLIVIGSIVAFSAHGIANRLLPTATVATYAYVNPVIAVLLGTLILGENLTTMMIIGGVLIVGAVVLVVRRTPLSH